MISKATIKYIQNLQDKKHRDAAGCFVAEGMIVLKELLAEGKFDLQYIFADAADAEVLKNLFGERLGEKLEIAVAHELEKLSSRKTPSGAIAVFYKKKEFVPENLKGKITLALYDLQDPGNLGTIIRTADWFGIENIFCSRHTTDMYNPKVVQSTMASIGRVGVHYVDMEEWLEKTKIKKYAATLDGKILRKEMNIESGILLIGNEANGLPAHIIDKTDEKITIAKKGKAESLNAAVATGIILSLVTT